MRINSQRPEIKKARYFRIRLLIVGEVGESSNFLCEDIELVKKAIDEGTNNNLVEI